MARASRTCVTCPTVITSGSRCDRCARTAERVRGTVKQRGYSGTGHRTFRAAVLDRDPVCVQCRNAWSTVADHYPHSRRDLVDAGKNPNDPQYGRGLCLRCHSIATAQHQPGGWNVRA